MKDNYQELFSYMAREHGVTLLLTEMQDLINVVEKSKWIKIEDELPPLRTYVIGYVVSFLGRPRKIVCEVFLSKDKKWMIDNDYCIVTHWMPLPEPPEE
jgi:hypothetical protein